MATNNKVILPYRDYSEHEVVNDFALDTTGQAGQLVKVSVGNFDTNSAWAQGQPVGGTSYQGVLSNFFVNSNKVTAVSSGDSVYTILGMTLVDTRITDDNGLPLWHAKRNLEELAAVYSGHSVPVVRRGRFSIKTSAVEGTIAVGSLVVPASGTAGKIAAIPSSRVWTGAAAQVNTVQSLKYLPSQVLGKFIGTGSKGSASGYADFVLALQ